MKKPSDLQEKKMVAMILMAIVIQVFENHLYKFYGHVYGQVSGGPVSENATNDVANIITSLVDYTFVLHQ